jgi:hypothetical protein
LTSARPAPLDPGRWQDSRAYLRAIDLFNHGYYWEAHEVWEGLWHACGRSGQAATLLKGLIRLAAAGVKVRQGRPEGVRSHARRAEELFRELLGQLEPGPPRFLGLSLPELIVFAESLAERPEAFRSDPSQPVEVVFPLVLRPLAN